jgi:hypothetical protein
MATNVMLFSGIGLAVLGVGAYFLFPEREKQPDVRAHAFVTPTSFGLAASGKFGGL